MICFTCPSCDVRLRIGDDKAGTKRLCPECGEQLLVPLRLRNEENGRPARAAARPPAAGERFSWLLTGAAAVACFALVGGGLFWALSRTKGDAAASRPQETAQAGPPAAPAPSAPPPLPPVPPPANVPDAKPGTEPAAPPAPPLPGEGTRLESLEQNQVTQRLLKSTAWIVTLLPGGGAGSGSGFLVDRENKLVLTNHHVIRRAKEGRTMVVFPIYDKGKLVQEMDRYLKLVMDRRGVSCSVEIADEERDLALVKLIALPEGVQTLPLAPKGAMAGQRVHSLGNPMGGAMWVYTPGVVRNAAVLNKWVSSNDGKHFTYHRARVISSTSPTNHGDSGGPLVNDQKQLVAVTQGGARDAQLMSIFIDVSEVRYLLNTYYQSKGLKPLPAAGTDIEENPDLPDLLLALKDKDTARRAKAALILGQFGPEGRRAIPDLVKALKDESDAVRKNAAVALEQVGELPQTHLPAVLEALADPNAEVRLALIATIKLMRSEAEAAGPTLGTLLKNDKDERVRRQAAAALGEISPKGAAPVLAAALMDDSAGVRSAAAEALAKLGREAAPALGALAAALKDNQQDVRLGALKAITAIGPEAKAVLPQIHSALKERDRETRLLALEAVAVIGAEDAKTIEILVDLVQEKDLRRNVAAVIARIGKATVPVLVKKLGNPGKTEAKVGIIFALGELGPDARGAWKALQREFQANPHPDVRKAILEAGRKIDKQ